jgi:ABC-type branched-subunit amino acid transport system ATPase component
MVEQNARMALAIAGEGHLLETGRLVLSGLDRPGADPGIIETYVDSDVS